MNKQKEIIAKIEKLAEKYKEIQNLASEIDGDLYALYGQFQNKLIYNQKNKHCPTPEDEFVLASNSDIRVPVFDTMINDPEFEEDLLAAGVSKDDILLDAAIEKTFFPNKSFRYGDGSICESEHSDYSPLNAVDMINDYAEYKLFWHYYEKMKNSETLK